MEWLTGHLFSLLNLGASILYTVLGVYVLRLDRRSPLNVIIAFTCAVFAIWAFCFSMIHSATDVAAIGAWYDISAAGWCLFSGLALHFMYRLTGAADGKTPWYMFPVFYLPGLVFFLREYTGVLAARDFRFVRFGYAEVPPLGSPWYWAFLLYQAGYVIAALVILLRWRSSANLKREKLQARTMFLVGVVSLVLCFTMDILLPALDIFALPALSSVLILIWAWGMVFAIRKYRLMTMTLDYASRRIVEVMNDMLILLDHHGRIDAVNQKAGRILGLSPERIRNTVLEDYAVEKDVIRERIDAVLRRRRTDFQIEMNLIVGGGDIIPFHLEASAHTDRFGDIMGVIITGHDISDKAQLLEEIAARRMVEEELRKSRADLEKRNEIIGQGLRDAMTLQKTLLPGGQAPGENGLISYLYEPVGEVGGDFCDFIRFREHDRVGIFISDVSGHGVKAAFITALYGIYRTSDRRLLYAGAGHNPPYLVRRGDISELECAHSLPLAVMSSEKMARYGRSYINREARLEAGDKVLFYTDGLSEAMSAADGGKLFIAHGLDGALREHATEPGEKFLEGVLGAARRFRGVDTFRDDVCMVCLDVK